MTHDRTACPVVPHHFPATAFEHVRAAPTLDDEEPERLSAALIAAAEELRNGAVVGEELDTLAGRLFLLSRHPSEAIRREIALTASFVRHELFDEIVTELRADASRAVREAADTAILRRRERAQTELGRGGGAEFEALLADIEGGLGIDARRAVLELLQRNASTQLRAFRHELIRLLTPLEMTLEQLARHHERGPSEKTHELAHRAVKATRLLGSLSEALLHMSAVNDEPFEVERLAVVVHEAADVVRGGAGPLAERLLIHINVADHAVAMHRPSLLVAFRNLLQNGLEASDSDRDILLEVDAAYLPLKRVTLRFRDFGLGMPPQIKREAFALFSTIKPGGTGVGLTIVRKIIEAEHGGTVRLADSPAGGTDVVVVLPIHQTQ